MAFWMYAVVALGWFTGGIVGGATGMGSVMVSMPILMTVFPAGDAVLISCLCALYGNIRIAVNSSHGSGISGNRAAFQYNASAVIGNSAAFCSGVVSCQSDPC